MNNVRYAIRVLFARPGFSAVAILTLALGIGANTAIFTVVNAVLLRPLPFDDPGRLVLLLERTSQLPTVTTSWPNYVEWRDQSRSFDSIAAMRPLTMTLTGQGEPDRIPAKMVTASWLPTIRVSPAIGRAFTAEDDKAGAPGVVLLTDALWRRRYGAAPDAVGRAITLDNQPYTIVGVMPPRFQLLQPADVLLPIGPWAATLPMEDRTWHPGILPIARLKHDTDLSRAQAELDVISERLARQYPEGNHGVSVEPKPLHDYAVQSVRQSLLVLVAAVGVVLLIACANVANLLLARAVGRQKEIAIRRAIGASRSKIAAQLLVESVMLALCGGLLGLLLAVWSLPLLAALAGGNTGAGAIGIDPSALLFTIAVSIATGFIFGLAPALHTTRVDVSAAINESGRGAAAGAGHHRLRSLLVVAEMALATMLLVTAGLLARSLLRLQDVSPGFDASGVLVADAPLSPVKYATGAERNAFVDRLRERVRALPGVAFGEVATAPPFSGNGSSIHFNIAGRPPKGPEDYIITGYRAVSDGYFSALGVPLTAGRFFTDRDREQSPPIAIVNEAFVRRFLGGGVKQAVGVRAQVGTTPGDDAPLMEIVGVVGDTRQAFDATTQPTMYVPYLQYPIDILGGMYRSLSIVLKTTGDPASLAGGLRAAVQAVDRDQPLVRVRTMEEAMTDSVSQPRLRTTLLALFSAVALALSLIGVYGVMAYVVSERTHEIGVRLALGASPADIRALVVGQGTRLAGIGIAVGVGGALITSRALGALLFGVSATDPATFAIAALLLAVAGVAAAYMPARRASHIDPVALLR